MDPRLLRHYNQELLHLREMGAEFAAQFPKIAARLRMDNLEVGDPHVERLLEGFAFLTARIQLKLDAEFPRFTQRMAEILYPQFLSPIPSMLVAQLQPDLADAGLSAGVTVPRGSPLRARPMREGGTACEFRTGQDATLWPIEITAAEYFSHAADLPIASRPQWKKYAGGLRISLRATAGLDFTRIALRDLRLYCRGADDVAYRLHELACGNALGVFVLARGPGGPASRALEADAIQPVGFEDEHALLPATLRGFAGYRLVQEYFAFPQRFLFFDVVDLGRCLRELGGAEADLVILFSRAAATLPQSVDARSIALHCVPAVNLFEHRCDRVPVTPTPELHVVPDRVRPLDFEVHGIQSVTGIGAGLDSERKFRPLYSAFHADDPGAPAYFTVQREPRVPSAAQRRDGPRSAYVGSEVYLSLVDQEQAPYADDLQQLAVTALCSNRDLPLLMPLGSPEGDLQLAQSAPVKAIRVIKGPSRPLPAPAADSSAWRLVNQLTLNHLSLVDTDDEQGAAALRQMLRLYVDDEDAALQRQIEGLRSIAKQQVVRRLPMPGPIAFGRGVQLDVVLDEPAFEGGSAFLFGCILERFFARHVSINTFTATRVRSPARGLIMDGRPRCGARPIL